MSARPLVRGKRVLRRTRTNNEAGDALRQATEVHGLSCWLFDFTRASCSPPFSSSLTCFSFLTSPPALPRSIALLHLGISRLPSGRPGRRLLTWPFRGTAWNRGKKETVKFNFVLIWLSKVGTWFCASKLLSRVLLIFPIYTCLIFGAVLGAPKQTHKSPLLRSDREMTDS